MKYIKTFEIRINDFDLPNEDERRTNLDDYKYKECDLVYHKKLKRIYMIKSVNKLSPSQDYYFVNPLDSRDNGWGVEEEVRDPEPEEIVEVELFLTANKYNL